MTSKKFTNFTDTSFTHKFDGIDYTFGPKETIFLDEFKAEFFAKHLVDRELNALGIPTNRQSERARLTGFCFPVVEAKPVEIAKPAEKKVKGKKVEETEFEDLNK